MSAALAFLTQIRMNPVLRAPTQLFASVAVPTGATTAATVRDSLRSAADVAVLTPANTNYVDVVGTPGVGVTGRGVLLFGAFYNGTNTANCDVTVTIDGVVVLNAATSGLNSLRCFAGCVSGLDTTAVSSQVSFGEIPFLVSLRIQVRSTSAATTMGAAAKYELRN